MTTPGIKGPKTHFDTPNVLAHTRVKDYTQDGQKILHVDEVQSDWHQKGRKVGYQPTQEELDAARKEFNETQNMVELRGGDYTEEEALRLSELRYLISGPARIPDAPFKKNWHELMTRRILQEAAEKGYDRVTFTTGSQQAKRYDLSQQVKSIKYSKNNDGTYRVDVLPQGRNEGWRNYGRDVSSEKLDDLVGKDIAEKIRKGEGDEGRHETFLYNADFEIGGEGMKSFYDNMMVKAFNKEGKKYGVKVEPYKLKTGKNGEQVWSMEIPSEMRTKKKFEGSPLFSAAPFGLLFADQEDTGENSPMRSLMDF